MYILECCDGSYYVGHSDDLEKRVASHDDGTLGGYTFTRRLVRLIYAEVYDTRNAAFQRERQIKGWFRKKKEALARQDWTALRVFSRAAHPSTGSG